MMPAIADADLVSQASAVLNPRKLSPTVVVGTTGCALVTAGGATHVGISIAATCGLGFCAEYAAIASMVTHGESRIHTIVAVNREGKVVSPCGRCREFMFQIDPAANADTRILLAGGRVITLRQLLPEHTEGYPVMSS